MFMMKSFERECCCDGWEMEFAGVGVEKIFLQTWWLVEKFMRLHIARDKSTNFGSRLPEPLFTLATPLQALLTFT